MAAFWCILLSYITLKSFWKSERQRAKERKEMNTIVDTPQSNMDRLKDIDDIAREEELKKDIDKQKQRDIEELRKQGYTDELIAVILPTIYNGE